LFSNYCDVSAKLQKVFEVTTASKLYYMDCFLSLVISNLLDNHPLLSTPFFWGGEDFDVPISDMIE